jgi:hypothetical protein
MFENTVLVYVGFVLRFFVLFEECTYTISYVPSLLEEDDNDNNNNNNNWKTTKEQQQHQLLLILLLLILLLLLLLPLLLILLRWHAVAQLVVALRYKSQGRGFDSRLCHWNFLLTKSFRPHTGPVVGSTSDRNEYQEYFLGVKRPVWSADNLTTFMCRMSWNLGAPSYWNPRRMSLFCNGITLRIA